MKQWSAAPFEGRRAADIPQFEILQAAKAVLSLHGDIQACAIASARAVEFHRAGDTEGHTIWRRIAEALADWSLVEPPADPKDLS